MKTRTAVIVCVVGVGAVVTLRQIRIWSRENNARNQKLVDLAETGHTITRQTLTLPQYVWAKLQGGDLAVSV